MQEDKARLLRQSRPTSWKQLSMASEPVVSNAVVMDSRLESPCVDTLNNQKLHLDLDRGDLWLSQSAGRQAST
jgi:hypothetical protein